MHGIAKRGLALVAVASGVVMGTAGIAAADASAAGDVLNSGGVASGNLIQVPVNLPINACGDQVDAVGAVGNEEEPATCTTTEGGVNAAATGAVGDSGGLLSGNLIQAPIDAPINACGDQVDAVLTALDHDGPANCSIL